MNQELEFAKNLAREAGGIMRQYFMSANQQLEIKKDNTELTIADTTINQLVVDQVKLHYPEHAVMGEEQSHHITSDYVWVCDPIDGTFPFSHGIPVSSFNLALVHKGEPVVAVLYDPYMDRLFSAAKGKGAWLNDIRLHKPQAPAGRKAISYEVWGGRSSAVFTDPKVGIEMRIALEMAGYFLIYHCSVAYTAALVAAGLLTGVVFAGANPWDAAAVSLIVKEAGGVFTDIQGNEQAYNQPIRGFVAASTEQHAELLATIQPMVERYLA